ncbi:hypothetical protein TNCV_1052051 [Trichonephila clavipes]|nr:hypothetical protein TNCV_1052051 [Trichonephila clavipes]
MINNTFKIIVIEIKTWWQCQRRAFYVLEYARAFSVISVKRTFGNCYGKEAPTNKSTVCLYERKSSCRPSVSKEAVERRRQSFV